MQTIQKDGHLLPSLHLLQRLVRVLRERSGTATPVLDRNPSTTAAQGSILEPERHSTPPPLAGGLRLIKGRFHQIEACVSIHKWNAYVGR